MIAGDGEIRRLQRLLRANPRSLQFVALGEALRSRGRYQEAQTVLRDGLNVHPYLRSARVILARVYASAGQRTDALDLLLRLLPEEPDNLTLWALSVTLLLEEGRLAEARMVLQDLEDVDDVEIRTLRQRLQARLAAVQQSDPFATSRLAQRLESAGLWQRAARVWAAIGRESGDVDAHLRAANIERTVSAALVPTDRSAPLPPPPVAARDKLRQILTLLEEPS